MTDIDYIFYSINVYILSYDCEVNRRVIGMFHQNVWLWHVNGDTECWQDWKIVLIINSVLKFKTSLLEQNYIFKDA
jgi:hypothetical protein